ncbi:MAG: quinone-dependent dihydroorotate dehydrogenase [Bacteroidetes bacterium]|nr:quinone-dependent dihydroorotate dehydrogenase [Bacteroidota bacterium]
MYGLIKQVLFLLDAEKAHYLSMNLLRFACSIPPLRWAISRAFTPTHPSLKKNVLGLEFRNPVGLGAGFDKNARYLRELNALGFGSVEIGTVTPLPQIGNDKPRLFRLPADHALINRMGFNNDGLETIAKRLHAWKSASSGDHSRMIIGGNIGKNKSTPNETAWKDYETCFNGLFDVVDYFVVNVSSPNTPGLRALQDKEALKEILNILIANNQARPTRKPLLLKIAPDLTDGQLQDIADLSRELQLDGIVSSNTTISRDSLSEHSKPLADQMGAGGLSGRPLKLASDAVLSRLHALTNGSIPIIASGGVFTGNDAIDKLNHGAHLVQVWTGFIYEGPGIVASICKKLIHHVR